MYYIDTLTYGVDVFDFDVESGSISHRRKLFCFNKNSLQGFPDGMAIDEAGHLWVACFGGGQASVEQDKNYVTCGRCYKGRPLLRRTPYEVRRWRCVTLRAHLRR